MPFIKRKIPENPHILIRGVQITKHEVQKMDALIDWISFTDLSTNEPEYVIKKYLKLDIDIFSQQGYGIHGYKSCMKYDNIKVYYNGRAGTADGFNRGTEFMGVYVSLSGDGVRQYVNLGKHIDELLALIYASPDANITRLDLAVDDKEDNKLDIDNIINSSRLGLIRTNSRNREEYIKNIGQLAPAKTIYIGSRKSEQFIRIYDKAKEHYDPGKQLELYNSHWIRLEMVCRGERAKNALEFIINETAAGQSIGDCYAKILNGYMQFINNDDSNITRCSVAKWWIDFLDTLDKVKLYVTTRIKHVLERKLIWIHDNIAPLYSAIIEGIGTNTALKLIQVAKTRRKKEYNDMLKVYQDDVNRLSVQDLFGDIFSKVRMEEIRCDYYEVDNKQDSLHVKSNKYLQMESMEWKQLLITA